MSPVDVIICCRAGYGLRFDVPNQFMLGRMMTSAFACIHDRAQHASIKRLFDLRESGKLRGFIVPYLGQNDGRLKLSPDNLVSRESTCNYPTNFSAMTPDWIDRLSLRGEQLTKALWPEHAAEFTT